MKESKTNPYSPVAETQETAEAVSVDHHFGATTPFAIAHRIIFGNLLLFAVCYLSVRMPLELAVAYMDYKFVDADDIRGSFRLSNTASLWFGIIATGATIVVAEVTYDGKCPSFGFGMRVAFLRWGKMWTTWFCYSLLAWLFTLLLIVPGIIVMVRGVYADAIAVSENVHGPTAIRRSFELTKGRFWETFLVSLAVSGVYLAAFVFWGGAAIATYWIDERFIDGPNSWLLEAGVSIVIGLSSIYWHVVLYCWYRFISQEESLPSAQPTLGSPVV